MNNNNLYTKYKKNRSYYWILRFAFPPSTFETSTGNKPQYDNHHEDCSSYHQLHLEILQPHLSSKLPALPLEAVSLDPEQKSQEVNESDISQTPCQAPKTEWPMSCTWNCKFSVLSTKSSILSPRSKTCITASKEVCLVTLVDKFHVYQ
jgi:hypothetical protein